MVFPKLFPILVRRTGACLATTFGRFKAAASSTCFAVPDNWINCRLKPTILPSLAGHCLYKSGFASKDVIQPFSLFRSYAAISHAKTSKTSAVTKTPQKSSSKKKPSALHSATTSTRKISKAKTTKNTSKKTAEKPLKAQKNKTRITPAHASAKRVMTLAHTLGVAKRCLRAAVSKGSVTSPPTTDNEILQWYRIQIAEKKAVKAAREVARTKRLEIKQEIALKQLAKQVEQEELSRLKSLPKCNLRTAKKVANRLRKKGMLSTNGWNNDKYMSWYKARLLEAQRKKDFSADKARAKAMRSLREKSGKRVPLATVTDESLVEWYRQERDEALLARAQKAATSPKNKPPFKPEAASAQQLVFWYKLKLHSTAKRRPSSGSSERQAATTA